MTKPTPATETFQEELDKFRDWLKRRDARVAWTVDVPSVGAVTGYLVGADVVLVLTYEEHGRLMGWDAYLPASRGVGTEDTLQALDEHCFGTGEL